MAYSGNGTCSRQRRAVSWTGIGAIGLGLGLLGSVSSAGCGIGTDPSLLTKADGTVAGLPDAARPVRDAEASPTWPDGLPPIDRETHASTEVATFALG